MSLLLEHHKELLQAAMNGSRDAYQAFRDSIGEDHLLDQRHDKNPKDPRARIAAETFDFVLHHLETRSYQELAKINVTLLNDMTRYYLNELVTLSNTSRVRFKELLERVAEQNDTQGLFLEPLALIKCKDKDKDLKEFTKRMESRLRQAAMIQRRIDNAEISETMFSDENRSDSFLGDILEKASPMDDYIRDASMQSILNEPLPAPISQEEQFSLWYAQLRIISHDPTLSSFTTDDCYTAIHSLYMQLSPHPQLDTRLHYAMLHYYGWQLNGLKTQLSTTTDAVKKTQLTESYENAIRARNFHYLSASDEAYAIFNICFKKLMAPKCEMTWGDYWFMQLRRAAASGHRESILLFADFCFLNGDFQTAHHWYTHLSAYAPLQTPSITKASPDDGKLTMTLIWNQPDIELKKQVCVEELDKRRVITQIETFPGKTFFGDNPKPKSMEIVETMPKCVLFKPYHGKRKRDDENIIDLSTNNPITETRPQDNTQNSTEGSRATAPIANKRRKVTQKTDKADRTAEGVAASNVTTTTTPPAVDKDVEITQVRERSSRQTTQQDYAGVIKAFAESIVNAGKDAKSFYIYYVPKDTETSCYNLLWSLTSIASTAAKDPIVKEFKELMIRQPGKGFLHQSRNLHKKHNEQPQKFVLEAIEGQENKCCCTSEHPAFLKKLHEFAEKYAGESATSEQKSTRTMEKKQQ